MLEALVQDLQEELLKEELLQEELLLEELVQEVLLRQEVLVAWSLLQSQTVVLRWPLRKRNRHQKRPRQWHWRRSCRCSRHLRQGLMEQKRLLE